MGRTAATKAKHFEQQVAPPQTRVVVNAEVLIDKMAAELAERVGRAIDARNATDGTQGTLEYGVGCAPAGGLAGGVNQQYENAAPPRPEPSPVTTELVSRLRATSDHLAGRMRTCIAKTSGCEFGNKTPGTAGGQVQAQAQAPQRVGLNGGLQDALEAMEAAHLLLYELAGYTGQEF